ncbi:hypothetical protein EBT25_17375, partial [bacterium]|nr:hypothetical protein [bacterium]
MAATKFVAMLMNSRNQAHTFHLTTSSYAQHKALEKYYEKIVELLDDYAEAYMGKYGRIKRIIFVGQYIERKGCIPLARAFVSVADQLPDWELHMYGSG